ncbi:hypothetical protein FH972_022576 [Carpinus fangiana]|uniref:Uncharacterized protein n=1 Tax=Carpinus fangiana TaxID=176857 RepID=A0A5N6KSZ2_9ROSI|nr:hypothetical protein FH972_022576 [Carpinus fangiana]
MGIQVRQQLYCTYTVLPRVQRRRGDSTAWMEMEHGAGCCGRAIWHVEHPESCGTPMRPRHDLQVRVANKLAPVLAVVRTAYRVVNQ